jgi:hypothetical protein
VTPCSSASLHPPCPSLHVLAHLTRIPVLCTYQPHTIAAPPRSTAKHPCPQPAGNTQHICAHHLQRVTAAHVTCQCPTDTTPVSSAPTLYSCHHQTTIVHLPRRDNSTRTFPTHPHPSSLTIKVFPDCHMVHTTGPITASYVLCKLDHSHDTIPLQSRRIIVSSYSSYQPLGFKAFSRHRGPATPESTSCFQRVLRLPHALSSSPRLILASLQARGTQQQYYEPLLHIRSSEAFSIGLGGHTTT